MIEFKFENCQMEFITQLVYWVKGIREFLIMFVVFETELFNISFYTVFCFFLSQSKIYQYCLFRYGFKIMKLVCLFFVMFVFGEDTTPSPVTSPAVPTDNSTTAAATTTALPPIPGNATTAEATTVPANVTTKPAETTAPAIVTTPNPITEPANTTTVVPTVPAGTTAEVTTAAEATTVPATPSRGFSGSSFIGGMILSAALIAIGYYGLKFYQARNPNYRTL